MKKTKALTALVLAGAMLLALAGCGGSGKENTAPSIGGVADQMVQAGGEFDALAGVTATDAEDGDLTGKITVTSLPELSFSNGKVTPENPGDYELTYSVEDKGGLTAEAYATLTVGRQTGEEEVFLDVDFSAPVTADDHGWQAVIADGVQASGELKQGAYVFDITDPGQGDGDIQLVKSGVALKAADYKVKVWAKSTKDTYAHLLAVDEDAEEWTAFGGAYNLPIGTQIAPLELDFTAPGEGSAALTLNLGKITPNPDNADDTTPSDFTVTIDKIEIYEITGAQEQVPAYTADFASADEAAATAGDGASATATVADGAAVFQIDSYPTEGGVWSIKADLALPGVTVEAGQKYYYSFTVTAENDQSGECLVESAAEADAARANFNSLSLAAGEETVVTNVFTAEAAVSDPVIRMQIGSPADGVSANTLTVSALEFGTVEGDQQTAKTIDAFGQSIAGDPNPEVLWTTYNGTDEDNERGVGTVWTEDGSLFYRIDQGGNVDWHNKLILGHGNNKLTLPADSYFTVSITAKATKPVSCGFFLNPMGGWDPRVSQNLDLTEEEQTFTFDTTDTLILDMDFEMLFQFGSDATAQLGEVTVQISNITITQRSVV